MTRRVRELIAGTPLMRSALNLVSANLGGNALQVLGLLLATRLYAPAELGGGIAVLSAVSLLGATAGLGLQTGLLRFLPAAQTTARPLLARAMAINGVLAVLVGIVFVAGRSTWAANLPVVDTLFGAAVLIIAIATYALTLLQDGVLLATRRSGVLVARTWGAGALRMAGLVVLAPYGAFGVFGSWVVASGIATAAAATRVTGLGSQRGAGAGELQGPPSVSRVVRYSIKNYAIDLTASVPALLAPLIVIGLLGQASTAYYALGAAAGGVATGIARAATVSLFAEGSHAPDQLAALSRRALTFATALLLPITAFAFVFAEPVLAVFGVGYAAEGAWNLRLQVLSALPFTFVMTLLAVLRVRERLVLVFGITLLGCTVTVSLVSSLVAHLGVSGGGAAILLGQVAMLVVVTPWLIRFLRLS